MSPIVVTGLGAITPVGHDVTSTWQSLIAGRSGVCAIEEDWADDLPVRFAGQVDTDLSPWVSRVQSRRLDRVSQLAIAAAHQAWEDAGFTPDQYDQVDSERLGVCVGTGIGGLVTTLNQWDIQRDKGMRRMSPFTVPMLMSNAPAAHIGLMVGARAGVHAPVSACASSNEAIAAGVTMINSGEADVVVVGGSESTLHPMPINAFTQMQALSRRNDDPAGASRPWDQGRDGFVMAEGAAMLVLERLEDAQARGVHIYGTIRGSGMSADAHDLVQPDPDGRGQILAMRKAVERAGLTPSDIVHVNAHGTSTPQGDITEAHSIRRLLDSQADRAIVTSTKSMTGHLLGGAGALETLVTVLTLKNRVVPPTINLTNPEPDLPISIAANTSVTLPEGDLAALNNSFGFGGHNVAVALTNEHITN